MGLLCYNIDTKETRRKHEIYTKGIQIMRQVRVINTKYMTDSEMETAINNAMKEIHDRGHYVDKTEYGFDHETGHLGTVVIEYQ